MDFGHVVIESAGFLAKALIVVGAYSFGLHFAKKPIHPHPIRNWATVIAMAAVGPLIAITTYGTAVPLFAGLTLNEYVLATFVTLLVPPVLGLYNGTPRGISRTPSAKELEEQKQQAEQAARVAVLLGDANLKIPGRRLAEPPQI